MEPIKLNDKDVYIKLIDWFGDVLLVACRKDGQCILFGDIIYIKGNSGSFYRFVGLNKYIGIPLDEKRRIKV